MKTWLKLTACAGRGSNIHSDAMHKPISNLPRELIVLLFVFVEFVFMAIFLCQSGPNKADLNFCTYVRPSTKSSQFEWNSVCV